MPSKDNSKPARKAPTPLENRRTLYPRHLEQIYGISQPTRHRWEEKGLLPKRDVFLNGLPVGWRPATIEAARRGETVSESSAA